MTIPSISLSDLVNDFITSFNSLATGVGDLDLLLTTSDSSIVSAINSLVGQTGVDSAATITLSRSSISAVDSGGDGALSYNPVTGIINYRGPNAAEVRARFSAVAPASLDSAGVIRVADATTSIKGVASFATANFAVTSGAVSIKTGGIDSAAVGTGAITASKLAANAVGFSAMADSAVGSNELRGTVQLIIYNSAGTPVKTLYGAGV